MTDERLDEIMKLDIKTLRSLIKYYKDLYDKVTKEIYEEGWCEDLRDRANDLMHIISTYEWALHYKNIMTSDDDFSTEFHNVCRKAGRK